MKKSLFLASMVLAFGLLFSNIAEAKTVKVKGYYKPSTGTYVTPSVRTSPNRTKVDNYSTKGNYNPYSGKSGTKRGW